VSLLHVVPGEIEAVIHELPLGDHEFHEVVDRLVRISVRESAHRREIPATSPMRVPEAREIHGLGRSHDEEVSHPGCVVDMPVGGSRKEQPVLPITSDEVVFVGCARIEQPRPPVGVDLQDRDVRVHVGPVVDPDALALLNDGLGTPIDPHPSLQRLSTEGGGHCDTGREHREKNRLSGMPCWSHEVVHQWTFFVTHLQSIGHATLHAPAKQRKIGDRVPGADGIRHLKWTLRRTLR
jgi:hypothetical protein